MTNDGSDIQALRERLDGTKGREYWRSLEAVAETPAFKDFLHREFPSQASEWLDPVGRRGFLKLAGLMLLGGVPPYQVWLPLVQAGAATGRWDYVVWDAFVWG